MKTMRTWLAAGAVVCVLLPQAMAAPLTGDAAAVHVLNRLGYGPRPGDVARVAAMGVAPAGCGANFLISPVRTMSGRAAMCRLG